MYYAACERTVHVVAAADFLTHCLSCPLTYDRCDINVNKMCSNDVLMNKNYDFTSEYIQ